MTGGTFSIYSCPAVASMDIY